ncbi:unnamed protein product [Caenorhabditis angaria]|uniref:Uncharacterized protein n=1 Tax=Caenorhabditis angaria TaxID=860376 RepID=A0A9P1J4I0_9PELO|nr:unnamed protein product [Caenorhabditis angaria]
MQTNDAELDSLHHKHGKRLIESFLKSMNRMIEGESTIFNSLILAVLVYGIIELIRYLFRHNRQRGSW